MENLPNPPFDTFEDVVTSSIQKHPSSFESILQIGDALESLRVEPPKPTSSLVPSEPTVSSIELTDFQINKTSRILQNELADSLKRCQARQQKIGQRIRLAVGALMTCTPILDLPSHSKDDPTLSNIFTVDDVLEECANMIQNMAVSRKRILYAISSFENFISQLDALCTFHEDWTSQIELITGKDPTLKKKKSISYKKNSFKPLQEESNQLISSSSPSAPQEPTNQNGNIQVNQIDKFNDISLTSNLNGKAEKEKCLQSEIVKFVSSSLQRLQAIKLQMNDTGMIGCDVRFANAVNGLNLRGIAEYMLREKPKKVIVMSGAGISVAAGIPDFRSPGTGLYYNVQKYNLPNPTSIFTLDYYKQRPEPFLEIAKELYPGKFMPTLGHYFIRMLQKKQMLLRNYTQNIDCLERLAGIPAEYVIEAHGTFAQAHCLQCNRLYSATIMKQHVMESKTLLCESCNALVKPDVIMFGENLPHHFFQKRRLDFPQCDLLIVIGTSLKVEPFKYLIHEVPTNVPRLLINREKVAVLSEEMEQSGVRRGFLFDQAENYRDVFAGGDCDKVIMELVDLLGWRGEMEQTMEQERKAFQEHSHKLGF